MLNVKKIKDIREDHDITQQKMADILGVKRSTYSLWEIGISTIPLKNLCDFVDYFEISLDNALGLHKNRSTSTCQKGMDFKVLGENIKRMRIEKGLSQMDVAKSLGVSQACIVRYEKGIICISINNLYALSKIFKVSFTTLCGKEIRHDEKILQEV